MEFYSMRSVRVEPMGVKSSGAMWNRHVREKKCSAGKKPALGVWIA